MSAPPSAVEVKAEIMSTPTSNPSVALVENTNTYHRHSFGAGHTPIVQNQQPSALSSSPASLYNNSPAPSQVPTLKRNASHLSDSQGIGEQPRKRLRRDDIPIFAQLARKKAIRFGNGTQKVKQKQTAPIIKQDVIRPISIARTNSDSISMQGIQQQATAGKIVTNGHPLAQSTLGPGVDLDDHKWEPTIANEKPREDLSFAVANWIYATIGKEVSPEGGALFEVEAKIGEIHDVEEGGRLRLPVTTETVFNKEMWRRTRFESSMNMVCSTSA